MKAFKHSKGMTLVEIMVASAISPDRGHRRTAVSDQTLKSYQYETGKLMVNRDIRKFTTQMVDDATYASYFLIFDQVSNSQSQHRLRHGGTDNPCASNYRGYAAALAPTDPATPVSATSPGTADVRSGLPEMSWSWSHNQNGDNTRVSQLII